MKATDDGRSPASSATDGTETTTDARSTASRPVRPSTYAWLLRERLAEHPWHELLAMLGIAFAIALSIGALVANSSIGRSSGEITRGVTGSANLQVVAHTTAGVDGASVLARVRALPGVARAAGVLEQHAVFVGPNGRQLGMNVIAVDADLAALSGQLTRSFQRGALSLARGIVLPAATANALGVPTGAGGAPGAAPTVRVELRGRAEDLPVAAVFGDDTLGPLAAARAAVMSAGQLGALTRLPGRVTRILVEAEPGQQQRVATQLRRLVAGTMTVTDVGADARMLDQALKPTAQATSFFALTAGLVGFLLAFNAVLLSAPDRRLWQARLYLVYGATPRTVATLIVLQSLLLALVGSVVGVALGVLLAGGLLHESPDYLAPAFTLGSRTVLTPLPIIISVAGGTLACMLASLPLLLDLRDGRAQSRLDDRAEALAPPLSRRTTVLLLIAAAAFVGVALAIHFFLPSAALVACGVLAIATLLTVPATFAAVLAAAGQLERRRERMVMLTLALRELRRTPLRQLALASTGAVAVFAAVALGGARHDLLRGIESYTRDYVSTAPVWITHAVDNQATNAFPISSGALEGLASVPGVRAVRGYYGGFLDIDERRVWIVAREPGDPILVPPSQMRDGRALTADARIRAGGSATVSDQLADALGVGVGDSFTLPTPTGPRQLRVAATTSNFGWSPGAIVMNARDYRSWWSTADPAALQVDVDDGADPAAVAAALDRRLDADGRAGIHAYTATERAGAITTSARTGLSRLGQISTMLLFAACLAMAAALGAAIWQRRPRIAADALVGATPLAQWRALLIESGLVIGAGCVTGASFGILGQIVIDNYLVGVTGFPVQTQVATGAALGSFALVLVVALAVLAIPGWLVARVGADFSFQR